MHLDVQDLKNFYYRSALGRAAQKIISAQVLKMWPVQSGYKMMGYGFANPILRHHFMTTREKLFRLCQVRRELCTGLGSSKSISSNT